jgi:hypothetical protein
MKQPDLETIEKAFAAEKIIEPFSDQSGLELAHHFAGGIYARELACPPNTIFVGKLHKFDHMCFLARGTISILIGDTIQTISAPKLIECPKGSKRVAYTHTDCIWVTILRTDLVEPDKIEEIYTAKTTQEYLEFCNEQLKLPLFEGMN